MRRAASITAFILMLVAGTPTPAHASIFGEENISLTAMLAKLTSMYEAMMEQLQQLKTQSEALNDTKEVLEHGLREYDAVKNLDLQRAIERVRSDVDNLTGLDELDGRDVETQLRGIARELDRRLDAPLSEAERRAIEAEKAAVEQELWLHQLQSASEKNAAKAAGALNEREAQQIEAQSAAVLAALAASERREAARLERLRAQDAGTAARMEKEHASMFRALGAGE